MKKLSFQFIFFMLMTVLVQHAWAVAGWKVLGCRGIAPLNYIFNPKLLTDNRDHIVFSYKDTNTDRLYIKRFATSWKKLGSLNAENIYVFDTALKENGVPVLSYFDSLKKRIVVKQLLGGKWKSIGSFPVYYINNISLSLDSRGRIYVAYSDSGPDGDTPYLKVSVKYYNPLQKKWVFVGRKRFTPGTDTRKLVLKLDSNKRPVLAFSSAISSYEDRRLFIYRFEKGNWKKLGNRAVIKTFSDVTKLTNWSFAFDINDNPVLAVSTSADEDAGKGIRIYRLVDDQWKLKRSPIVGMVLRGGLYTDATKRKLYLFCADRNYNYKTTLAIMKSRKWTQLPYSGVTGSTAQVYGALDSQNRPYIFANFNDETVSQVKTFSPWYKADFNADFKSDLVWKNIKTVKIWLMNEYGKAGIKKIDISNLGALQGFINMDNNCKSDMIFRNSDGNYTVRFDNGKVSNLGHSGDRLMAITYNERLASLLWRRTDGNYTVEQYDSDTLFDEYVLLSPTPESRIIGWGDVDDNGLADFLWKDGSKQCTLYLMDTFFRIPMRTMELGPCSRSVLNFVDLNGNGRKEIVWRNGSVWYFDKNGDLSHRGRIKPRVKTWQLRYVNDYSGDGRADRIWWSDEEKSYILQSSRGDGTWNETFFTAPKGMRLIFGK